MPLYGNPDVFINTNGARPVYGAAAYGSTFYIGTDQIEIVYTDRAVRSSCLRSTRPGAMCTFNVAVFGVDFSGFALVATIDGAACDVGRQGGRGVVVDPCRLLAFSVTGRVLPLVSGFPNVAYGIPNVWSFFTLNAVKPGADLAFSFTAFSGQVSFAVAAALESRTSRLTSDTPLPLRCAACALRDVRCDGPDAPDVRLARLVHLPHL